MIGFVVGTLCLLGFLHLWRGRRPWFGCGEGSEPRHRRWGRRGGDFWLRRVFERLDTTPGQEKVIRNAFRDVSGVAGELKDDLHGLSHRLASSIRQEEIDADELAELLQQGDEKLQDLRRAVIGALVEIHGVLDPQQRADLAAWLERNRHWGGPYRSAVNR